MNIDIYKAREICKEIDGDDTDGYGSIEIVACLVKEIESLRQQLAQQTSVDDTKRLNFLDNLNKAKNSHYKTDYGYKLILSPNVVRIYADSINEIDLNDANAGSNKFTSVREAIDKAMNEAKQVVKDSLTTELIKPEV